MSSGIDQSRIIYEDNHLIALNKKSGEIVQADKTGDAPMGAHLKEFLKEKYNKPGEVFVGVVHRLDRPVSGVVLFAKTSKGLERMNQLFRERETKKIYWAIVEQKPEKPEGKLIHWLVKNEKQNKSYASAVQKANHLICELDYKLLASSDRYHLLEVSPLTGRHHQIRVQLSTMKCIIKGDLKYGAKRSNPDGSICLHARRLEFMHPVKKEPVVIEAPVPDDNLWKAMQAMVPG
jgi:23S rRNA pseudouridine1911/1915/1917 synthase